MPRTNVTVLVVDDEPDIRTMLQCALGESGFELIEADDVPCAQQQINARQPDVVVLDWMLPTVSGLEFLQTLRSARSTRALPVIMLSAKTEEQDRVRALEAGADDYVCKPFSTRELRARIDAVLRRACISGADQQQEIRCSALTIDVVGRRAWLKDREIVLSPTEFDLLAFLVKHEEQAFSRGALMEQVWRTHGHRLDRTVDVHVLRLRKALAVGQGEALIQTVRGIGYRFSRHPS